MKKLIVMIALVVGTATFAQEKREAKHEMSSEKKLEKLTKELDLTKEQQARVKVLLDQKAASHKEKRAEAKEAMIKRKVENDEFNNQMKSILTEEQFKRYETKKAEMQKERGERMEKRGERIKERGEKKLEKTKK